MGGADLVRAPGDDVRRDERERHHKSVERRAVRGDAWLGVAAGYGGAGDGVLLRTLRVRQHDGPGYGALSGVPGRHTGRRRAADDGGAGAGLFFEPERGHDALRYRVGAGLL